jgi:metal-responsive CopG/Arc/MetJ family transcriptional regulator
MRKEYQAVSLQKPLLERIDTLIEGKGFASRAEFVRYCVFKELEKRGIE